MTPYHEAFIPIFLLGCFVAAITSFFAGRGSGCALPGFFVCIGVLAFWAALFFGSDQGYRAWQAMPDPPAEAFSDASVMGALLVGWVPGLIFCLTIFGFARGFRWLLHWANPDVFPSESEVTGKPTESGNPYQSPGN